MSGRSHLYVPADRARMLEGATARGADALIIDLEDAVAPAAKPAARQQLASWLSERAGGAGDERTGRPDRPLPELWVRVNPVDAPDNALAADLAAAVAPGVAGICLAKTRSPADLEQLDALLAAAEARAGLAAGSLGVSALIETAAGLLDARAIAAGPRVRRLQIGEADLSAELGIKPGPDEAELLPVRLQLVVASAAAGIEAPVGPVSTNFSDLEAFRASTERLLRLGFGGRAVIHPAQIATVHEVFSATPEELRRARALLEQFGAAQAAGSGVTVDGEGRMVDEAVVRAARRVLDRGGPVS